MHYLRRFVGIVNYYQDMCHNRTHTIAPLLKIPLTKVNFKCRGEDSNTFIPINKIVGRYFILPYPNFIRWFIINTDASKTQLGGVIIQKR